MSEALPPRPDLNWLKNRAKEELARRKGADPECKLADAQLAIAREYGFGSWRKLKAHIDALHDAGDAIVLAVRAGDLPAIAKILDVHPELVNATTDRDQRVLPSDTRAMRLIHVAVAENKIAAAKLLIEHGANVNLRNADGRLPIHDCFELGREEIEKLLLDAGAELDAAAAATLNRLDLLQSMLKRDPDAANDLSTNMTPLGWLGYQPNRTEAAQMLLDHGAIVNRPPYDGHALNPTAMIANVPVLKVLLKHGARADWRNKQGDTLMHIALRSRMVKDPLEYIQTLLDAGCDPHARNDTGRTALDEAVATNQKSIEDYATKKATGVKNYEKVIELLRGTTTQGTRDDGSPAAPVTADEVLIRSFADAIRGDIEIVRKMLDEHPGLARATIEGMSMLHQAAGYNRVAAIRLLVERGADVNVYWTGNFHTPLSWAVTNNWPEASGALVECGAKVDLFCAAGMGLLDRVKTFFDDAGKLKAGASITGSTRFANGVRIAELSSDPVEIVSDAHYIACRNGRVETAIYLLDHGADPNFRGYMNATCFHWAYFGGGDAKLVAAILAHGGDANAAFSGRKWTPRAFGILQAATWGWPFYIKRILDNDPSLTNLAEAGTTPLHEAARNGHAEAVRILLARGADRARLDVDGKTALDKAVDAKHPEVVALLQ